MVAHVLDVCLPQVIHVFAWPHPPGDMSRQPVDPPHASLDVPCIRQILADQQTVVDKHCYEDSWSPRITLSLDIGRKAVFLT